jgi:RecA/RadA recombinase
MPRKPKEESPAEESTGDRRALIAKAVEGIRGQYGRIVGAGTSMALTVRRISSGSFMLDYSMGGGLPEGRITMFKGPKGSGKTTNATRIVASAQGLCRRCFRPAKITDVIPVGDDPESPDYWKAIGECDCIGSGIVLPPEPEKGEEKGRGKEAYEARVEALKANSYEELIVAWVDMEMTFDWLWAKCLGVDARRLMYSRPETGEEAIDTLDPLLRTGGIDLIVIDSIAHFIPSVEIEASMYEQQQGVMARLVNKGVRKFVSAVASCANTYGRVPTQIWINQEREKLGPFPGKVTPGGKGQGFATSVELDCWSAKREVDKIVAGNKEDVIHVPKSEELHFKCSKNKTFSPGIEGFYKQILTDVDGRLGQIEESEQLYRFAMHFGILLKDEKAAMFTYKPTGFTSKTVKDMKAHVDENMPGLKRELMKLLLMKG